MANKIGVQADYSNAEVWADTTDYSSTVTGLARTAQIDLTSLASGSARQGAKADISGSVAASRMPNRYLLFVGMEFASAPTSQETIDLYWAGSPSSTAGNANPGGASGSDAAYTGTSGDSLDDSLLQLQFLASLVATADASTTVQYQSFIVTIPNQYGMPIAVNNTSVALHSDAVEMLIALIPLVDEAQ